jgi:hypothetical protein
VLVANRWVHTGVRDSGCLGRSSRGHVLETLLTEGDKKRWEWAAVFAEEDKGEAGMRGNLCMGPFILPLDSFYGLTGNFSCFITCFEAISYSFPPFDAFPTCGQASTLGSWDSIGFLLFQGSVLAHQEL